MLLGRLILILSILSCLISCKEDSIDEELLIPESIEIEKLPIFVGGEKI